MKDVELPRGAATLEAERGLLWLPLLQRLTVLSPRAVVWKNASTALEGHGDLDVIAPPADWDAIESEFRSWAEAAGLGPVAVCRHVPGSMFLLAADPERPAFFELDIKARGSYRGRTVFRSLDLQPLAELDSRGFRRLRPGAEGVLKLILNGTADDGSLDPHRVRREGVAELLREDPAAVAQATQLFGRARTQVEALVDGFLRGEWDRSRMLTFRARMRLGLIFEPAELLRRLWGRIKPGPGCRGIKSLIKEERLRPGDATALQQLVRAHRPVAGAPAA
jgi:hypothetical protein